MKNKKTQALITAEKKAKKAQKLPSEAARSNRERFNAYHKKSKSGKLFYIVLIMLREYGIFLIPLFPSYLLFYYVVFKNGGASDGTQWLYLTLLICILAVLAAGFFLRKMWRTHRFIKFSQCRVPLFKGNIWRCPFCGEENRLLSPCKSCGIFPELYKSDKGAPKMEASKKRSRKEIREFDSYVPQFEEE